jgi:hypothetical protein
MAKNGLKTFVCSETQKFGHVTFFWNGNRSGYFNEELETYVEIPSDTVPFNEAPDMKAREICEAGKEALRSGKYDQVRINFANPDMVGHTGDLEATKSCCALVDSCVKVGPACRLLSTLHPTMPRALCCGCEAAHFSRSPTWWAREEGGFHGCLVMHMPALHRSRLHIPLPPRAPRPPSPLPCRSCWRSWTS